MWRYALLFSLVLFTGFYNLVSSSWSSFHRVNLVLHPALSAFATVTIIASLYRRVRAQVPSLGPAHLASFVLVSFVALVRAFTLKHLPELVSNYLTWILTPVLVVGTGFLFVKTVPLLPRLARVRQGWAHLSLVSLWLLSFLLGALIVVYAFGGRVPVWTRALHSALGYGAAGVGFWVLVRPSRRLRLSREVLAGVAGGLLVVVAIAAVVDESSRLWRAPAVIEPVELHLSVIPWRSRAPADRDPVPFGIDASWLVITDSCSTAGCHDDLLDDFRRSIHNTSYRPSHIRKVLDLLATEEGAESKTICAGCHVPASLFRGAEEAVEPWTGDGMSCVVCHSISDVAIDDLHRSRFTLAPNADHLAPFRAAEARGKPLGRVDQALIQLNPDAHGRVFSNRLLSEDRFCLGCHHLNLQPSPEGSRSSTDSSRRLACIDCHMGPAERVGGKGGARNHFFPGSNVATPTLLGATGDAARTQQWMSGGFLVRELEDPYKAGNPARALGEPRKRGYFYAEVRSAFATPIEPGSEAVLVIETHNLSMGHTFPSSSIDLQEAWLEVRVTDTAGREVFASGGVAPDQQLLPGTHTLGGQLLDEHGRSIEHYRVWAAARVVIDRQVDEGRQVADRFSFRIPDDVGDHLNVEALWRYRKLGHSFWAWAYSQADPIPSAMLVRHFTQYPVTRRSDRNPASTDGSPRPPPS